MKEYVFDANALIRLYRNSAGADVVEGSVRQAKAGRAHLSISVVSLAEVLYILTRFLGQEKARMCVQNARMAVETMPVTEENALNAAALRTRYNLGLADCFAAELTIVWGRRS